MISVVTHKQFNMRNTTLARSSIASSATVWHHAASTNSPCFPHTRYSYITLTTAPIKSRRNHSVTRYSHCFSQSDILPYMLDEICWEYSVGGCAISLCNRVTLARHCYYSLGIHFTAYQPSSHNFLFFFKRSGRWSIGHLVSNRLKGFSPTLARITPAWHRLIYWSITLLLVNMSVFHFARWSHHLLVQLFLKNLVLVITSYSAILSSDL